MPRKKQDTVKGTVIKFLQEAYASGLFDRVHYYDIESIIKRDFPWSVFNRKHFSVYKNYFLTNVVVSEKPSEEKTGV